MASSRCVVIGNGPSLTADQLAHLVGHVTFAVGRINLMYEFTDWRPTFYVMAEKLDVIDEMATTHDFRQIVNQNGTYSFIQSGLMGLVGAGQNPMTEPFETCQCARKEEPPERWHLPELCSYGSSVHVALQIAVNMDCFDEIYLIGCDLDGGHFVEDYGPSQVQTDLWYQAHRIANRSSPIPIFNATIGGKLDIYEKRSL